MLTIEQRTLAVLCDVWRTLPLLKTEAFITSIALEDLNERHGSYDPDTGTLSLNTSLFQGDTAAQILLIDINGDSPPQRTPWVSRAFHTACHEIMHAIGAGTGLDATPEWLQLSGWVEDDNDPQGTGRYYENRPGWPQGPSSWRYRTGGTWFARSYSTKAPAEDFADTATHIVLGWQDVIASPNGLAKLRYLRREVWGERGRVMVAAARNRWQARWGLQGVARPTRQQQIPVKTADIEDEIEESVQAFDEEQRKKTLLAPWAFGDVSAAVLALSFVLTPLALRLYQQVWQETMLEETGRVRGRPVLEVPVQAIQQAARSHVTTTQDALRVALAKLPADASTEAVDAVVHKVYDQAATRARLVAETEAHRATQAARLAAWQTAGTVQWGVWRTAADERVCGWCGPLDGRRVPLGDLFFHVGETVQDATGKLLSINYADIQTPPLHGWCRCTLEAE